jgi:hypothetical protein
MIVAGVYAVLDFVAPWSTLEGDFQAVTGQGYDAAQPGGVAVATLYLRHLSVLSLTAVVASLFILFAAFRRCQRWAWWALMVTGVLAWGFGTVINLIVGNTFDFATHLGGLVVQLVGLLLPVRSFFDPRPSRS